MVCPIGRLNQKKYFLVHTVCHEYTENCKEDRLQLWGFSILCLVFRMGRVVYVGPENFDLILLVAGEKRLKMRVLGKNIYLDLATVTYWFVNFIPQL